MRAIVEHDGVRDRVNLERAMNFGNPGIWDIDVGVSTSQRRDSIEGPRPDVEANIDNGCTICPQRDEMAVTRVTDYLVSPVIRRPEAEESIATRSWVWIRHVGARDLGWCHLQGRRG